MAEEYAYHKVADLFPMMGEEAFACLCKDIEVNGLLQPIWLHEGQIIDGRNRYQACLKTGVKPEFREWDGKGGLVAFVVSLNLNRRHLNSSQLAVLSQDLLPMLEAEAKERQRQSGGDRKSDEYQESVLEEIPEPIEPHQTSVQLAAQMTGTNPRYVQDMKTIAKEAPERVQDIRDGKAKIPEVMKEIRSARQKKLETEASRDVKCAPKKSRALGVSSMVIEHLRGIDADDPQRLEALNRVKKWITKRLEAKQKTAQQEEQKAEQHLAA